MAASVVRCRHRRRPSCWAPFALLLAVVATVALVTWRAPGAAAHASLVDTQPRAGDELATAPRELRLRFDEPVEAALGGVQLFDADGRLQRVGSPRVDGHEVVADLGELPDGPYVVSWRVQSVDGHPVSGAFTFRVGTGGAALDPGLIDRVTAGRDGSDVVSGLLAASRTLGFAGIAVLFGTAAVLLVVWPAAAGRRASVVLLAVAAGLTAVGAVAGVALLGPYATGEGLGAAFRPSLWADVLDTRVGRAYALRLAVVALVVVPLVVALVRGRVRAAESMLWWAGALVATAGLIASVVLGGHATTGRSVPVGVVADAVHVLAMGVWLGGLVTVVVVLLPSAPVGELAGALVRWSRLAAVAVLALVASGLVQGWRQVGSLDALGDTDFGRLLVAKVVVVAGMLVLAAFARARVQRRWPEAPPATSSSASPSPSGATREAPAMVHIGPGARAAGRRDEGARRRLGLWVGGEVALGAVVLALTAVLVNVAPSRALASEPVSLTLVQGDVLASVVVDPARTGRNDVHVTLSSTTGALRRFDPIRVRMTPLSGELGPLEVPVQPVGPNHVAAYGTDLPFAGDWRLEVLASEGTSSTLRFATTIRVAG